MYYSPDYDFDLGYKNSNDFFYYPGFKFVTCVTYTVNK